MSLKALLAQTVDIPSNVSRYITDLARKEVIQETCPEQENGISSLGQISRTRKSTSLTIARTS